MLYVGVSGGHPRPLQEIFRALPHVAHQRLQPVPHPVVTLDPRTNLTWTELGKGHMDYRAILAAASAAGIERMSVELGAPCVQFAALEAAKSNYEYLQSIGELALVRAAEFEISSHPAQIGKEPVCRD